MKNLLLVTRKNRFLRSMRCCLLLILLPVLLSKIADVRGAEAAASRGNGKNPALDSDPANIHAIIVSTSRYWFNYRHAINALGMYEIYRQNGIPDENIILMIADEYAINARNPFKNRMHGEGIQLTGWYNNRTEIDYRGSDVTVQNFIDSLLGFAPKSLHNLNEESSLMIYLTGHGGNQFFKFQDEEELMAQDIANLMDRLHEEKKVKKALLIADTCQAFTIFDKVTTPNVMALGTSLVDENAYAHHTDTDLGLGAIERWTYHFIDYYRRRSNSHTTLHQAMVSPFDNKNILLARVGIKDDTSQTTFKDTKLSEFFGIKGGRKSPATTNPASAANTSQETDTLVQAFPESLLKLPSNLGNETRTPITVSEQKMPSTKKRTTNVCSAEEDDGLVKLSDNGFYFFLCSLIVTLVLVRKFEKLSLREKERHRYEILRR